jgi:hypothetical protein
MSDHLDITLENQMIRNIKPRNGWIQPDIGLRDLLSEQGSLKGAEGLYFR